MDALQALYAANPAVDHFPAVVACHFAELYAAPDAFDRIPVLGPATPPSAANDGVLVAFPAMVQDTSLEGELYMPHLPGPRCGGWGAQHDLLPHSPRDLVELAVVWAVSVPGAHHPPSEHYSPQPHKYPVPHASHLGLYLKIYDPCLAKSLRPTDLLTFVGILSSQNSTLHVFFSRPLSHTLVPRSYPHPVVSSTLRDELLDWIADQALAGDRDAAEWVLIAAIARVQSRSPPILPLSLTLSAFPPSSSTPALIHLLSCILPLVSTLPLSLNAINTTPFSPQSIEDDLHSGWLQLPKGSLCIVTEAGVTEGPVVEKGVVNLRTAQQVITAQTLDYIFPFSSFPFQTDINFIVLTDGRKSPFFQTHVTVTLQPPATGKDLYSSPKMPPEEKLEAFRELVAGAKVGSVTVSNDTATYIQEDFVKERKSIKVITSDDFVHRIMVARLLALSFHKLEITPEIWEAAKSLDAKRRAKLVNI